MALDFRILTQTPDIGARYIEGLQAAQAEQERNMLRQQQMAQLGMQRENMLAQRADREAQRGEREAQARLRGQQELELKARMERAAREEGYLNKVSELFANNGMPLNLKTAQQGLSYAIKSGDKNAIDMMGRAVTALQEREALQAAFGGQAAPAAAPSMMRQPPAAAAPAAARTNMFAGTPFDIGTTQPAPVNALAAPPQAPAAPAAGGMSRERLQAIIADPNASQAVVDRAKALLTTLPKEPSVPSRIQEFSAFQKMTPEDQKAYLAHQAALQPKPAQLSVKLPEQEKAERGERGKLLVEQFKDVSKAASLAAKTLPYLETQERILNAADFGTGFGTETKAAAAKVLSALGVPEANQYATNAQTFLAASQQAVLQKQLEQKGTQTQADANRIEQTGAQLGSTKDANKFIVSVAKAQLKRDIDQRNFYDKWWKENKTYDGAEDAWFSGEGGKSLFDRPELKQYAAPAKAAPQKASSIQEQADAVLRRSNK